MRGPSGPRSIWGGRSRSIERDACSERSERTHWPCLTLRLLISRVRTESGVTGRRERRLRGRPDLRGALAHALPF